jgi:hypothetical protein
MGRSMERWRIRHGIPYRVQDGDRELLVGLNDVDDRTNQARLSVHDEGTWVAGFDLREGDDCEIAGRRWRVVEVATTPRPYIELEELS